MTELDIPLALQHHRSDAQKATNIELEERTDLPFVRQKKLVVVKCLL